MMVRRRTRRAEGHAAGQERWLVSYADFITLLFAFFTVLFATSERNVKKQKEFESSVRQSFQAFIPAGSAVATGDYAAYNKSNSMVQAPLEMYQHKQTNTSYEDELRLELVRRMGEKQFSSVVASSHAEGNGVRLSMVTDTVFAVGSAKISGSAAANLNKMAEVLANTGKRIIVEAHTNSETWDLSSVRASTLTRYLAQKSIPAERLSAVAYADAPLAGSDRKNHPREARVDILVQTTEP